MPSVPTVIAAEPDTIVYQSDELPVKETYLYSDDNWNALLSDIDFWWLVQQSRVHQLAPSAKKPDFVEDTIKLVYDVTRLRIRMIPYLIVLRSLAQN